MTGGGAKLAKHFNRIEAGYFQAFARIRMDWLNPFFFKETAPTLVQAKIIK